MAVLALGLILFLAVHSIRIVAEPWRSSQIQRRGEKAWKGLYTLLSLAGLALIVWGFGLARAESPELWAPPAALHRLTALLTLPALILVIAAYVPGNRLKARLGHPMVIGVALWAFAHLLSNGRLADVLLFAAFLAWALLSLRAARARDRASPPARAAPTLRGDLLTIVIGVAFWAVFGRFLHLWLIGVQPMA